MKPLQIDERRACEYKAACDAFATKMKLQLLAIEALALANADV